MQVLVTGGTGFLGSQIVTALVRRGDAVRVLRRASSSLVALEGLDVEHVIGDILDTEAVGRASARCDMVFHIAALSSYWRAQRADIYRTNVEGTRAVMQACLDAGVRRVVHTSSVAAIGLRPDGTPADETTPFDALSSTFAYADSKHRAEVEVGRAVGRGLDAVIVNPAIVIGAGDHYMISGSMIVEFARGRVPATPPGGACMVDVDAVVQGHLAAAEHGRTGERYILGGENLTHRQVAQIIAEVVGRKPPALRLPRWMIGPTANAVDLFNRVSSRPPLITGEQLRMSGLSIYFDSRKAARELGFPMLPLRGAVEKAYRWYHEHDYC
jgi:dihydroflavonol-4-reductase